jgi:DNA-binding response OmpR family regulator
MNQIKPGARGNLVIVTGKPDPDLCGVKDFESQGFEVSVISQPAKALTLAELKPTNWRPALFIIDTSLPQASGFDLVRRLKEKWEIHKIPFIMMSEYASPEDLAESTECGAISLMKKPLTWAGLSDVIEKERMRRLKAEIGDLVFKIDCND